MSLPTYPLDLLLAQELVYEPNGLICTHFQKGRESQEYGACTFEINNKRVQFRVAKITPTKTGQFVTLWKRNGNGPIMPFDMNDPVDLFVVSVRNGTQLGQFVFPKKVLYQQGYVSQDGHGGKRAMRVYPPWDSADNAQAKKSQEWQLPFFFEIRLESPEENIRIQQLFS